jgi:hypothetical protein
MRWLLPAGSIGPRRYAINLLGPASDMTKQPDSTLRAPTTGYSRRLRNKREARGRGGRPVSPPCFPGYIQYVSLRLLDVTWDTCQSGIGNIPD